MPHLIDIQFSENNIVHGRSDSPPIRVVVSGSMKNDVSVALGNDLQVLAAKSTSHSKVLPKEPLLVLGMKSRLGRMMTNLRKKGRKRL